MSDLFHILKLTEPWGHNHLKHAKAYPEVFFPLRYLALIGACGIFCSYKTMANSTKQTSVEGSEKKSLTLKAHLNFKCTQEPPSWLNILFRHFLS